MVSFPDSVWDGDSGSRDSNSGVQRAPDHRDWTRMLQEIQAIQEYLIEHAHDGEGSINIYSGLTALELGTSVLHKTLFTFTDLVINITDAGVNGAHGSVKLYTFPDGHANTGTADLACTIQAGVGGISNTAALDVGVGSTAVSTSDETLATTEQNITTKSDVSLTGGTATVEVTNITPVNMDGEVAIYLNVAIEGSSCTGDDTLTVNGTFTLIWSNHHE